MRVLRTRILTLMLGICIILGICTYASAAYCVKARLECWDAVYPYEGYDSGTVYMDASKCNDGIHNEFQCKVTLYNNNGSTASKKSPNYVNATGTKSSGEVKANDRDALRVDGFASSVCHICNQGYGEELTIFRTYNF